MDELIILTRFKQAAKMLHHRLPSISLMRCQHYIAKHLGFKNYSAFKEYCDFKKFGIETFNELITGCKLDMKKSIDDLRLIYEIDEDTKIIKEVKHV